jgi:hypothetical protein
MAAIDTNVPVKKSVLEENIGLGIALNKHDPSSPRQGEILGNGVLRAM